MSAFIKHHTEQFSLFYVIFLMPQTFNYQVSQKDFFIIRRYFRSGFL